MDITSSKKSQKEQDSKETHNVLSTTKQIDKNNYKLWLIVFVLSWIMGSFGSIIAGNFRGSLINIFTVSLGAGLALLLFSAIPAFIISLGFRLAGKHLNKKNFILILICCLFIMGILQILGHLYNKSKTSPSSRKSNFQPSLSSNLPKIRNSKIKLPELKPEQLEEEIKNNL